VRRLPGIVALACALPIGSATAQWSQGAPGRIWAKSALFIQNTEERFGPTAQREPWIGNGRSEARAVFTDIIVGITPQLDLWLQAPYFDFEFNDAAVQRHEAGIGDVRLWGRYQLARLANGSLPIALRVGAKAPIGSSPLDGEIIPLGEGQWDLEGFVEGGYSFWPAPFYAVLWTGYRARLANQETRKDPGGEVVVLAEVGATPGSRGLIKATLDGIWGRGWKIEGLEIPTAARRLLVVQLGGGLRVAGPFWLEAGVRFPLSGRNMPAGTQFVVGGSAQIIR
jgi:hypothetical protein